MAPKKAAKKAAKHAPQKAPKKLATRKHAPKPKHKPGKPMKDTLRSYEHLGRITMLVPMLDPDAVETAKSLASIAQNLLRADGSRSAAEVLRAAEHFCFGTLAAKLPDGETVSADLKERIQAEYADLSQRASDHDDDMPSALQDIYGAMNRRALDAMRAASFRVALEYARGAEALTHVEAVPAQLPASKGPSKRLKK